jgi:hypothetical protein
MTKLSIAVHPEDHLQGDPAAPCTLVEYGDYQCPSCGQAYPMVKKLQRHFGERLALVFRNFPLTQIHPWAEPAAEVAEFAAEHGKFWQMHDQLFENQSHLSNALFLELAENLDLSPTELQAAVAGRTYRDQVRQEVFRRHPQRRQRHAHILHQRPTPQRTTRFRHAEPHHSGSDLTQRHSSACASSASSTRGWTAPGTTRK